MIVAQNLIPVNTLPTSKSRNSCCSFKEARHGRSEAELLAPSVLLVSTGVVVGEARLEVGQLCLVQETWVSVAKVNGWRPTHVTGTVAGGLRLHQNTFQPQFM